MWLIIAGEILETNCFYSGGLPGIKEIAIMLKIQTFPKTASQHIIRLGNHGFQSTNNVYLIRRNSH
jgi:hypothetical protein